MLALIAIGGNSLIRAGEQGTIEQQRANAARTAHALVQLILSGVHLVITHGNGPQVGAHMLRSELAGTQVPPVPLDVCGAATQGEIGYVLAQALENALADAGISLPIAALVTQTVVDTDDPAFEHPTKPIGPFYDEAEARARATAAGWQIVEDASRGYRRVVASPEPRTIVEADVINRLIETGVLVIAAGGGGIPVASRHDQLAGVEAVIDKDLSSSLLATLLRADLLIISTDVDQVYLDYGKPTQRPIDDAGIDDMQRYMDQGHFAPGSMRPKIEAALRFLRNGGSEVIITSPDRLLDALHWHAGTHIVTERPWAHENTLNALQHS